MGETSAQEKEGRPRCTMFVVVFTRIVDERGTVDERTYCLVRIGVSR